MGANRDEMMSLRKTFNSISLKEVMKKHVVTVYVDDPFSSVEQKMRIHEVRHLPVVDLDMRLVGIITQRDLYRIRSPRIHPDGTIFYEKDILDEYLISHTMTKNPIAMDLSASLADAIDKMGEKKCGCIPVVDERRVVCGIVTQTDVMKYIAEMIKNTLA
ncbi:MAG TPA: hypothetical protein DD723_03895 [Candidatus Omnitrophica bacterium]|nr:MAG: hypothetical protein A2Z81_00400 [Omnitrophica WOR_2 bacterium GWA2_45_18]HBR14673.1 hypothetical protein [Candidatus Omnitrophota bacterium]